MESASRLAVVTFNYDRSLEYYLFRTLMAAYRLEREDAAELMHELRIVHVYGQLGMPLFWAGKSGEGRAYNPDTSDLDLVERAAKQLKIVRRSHQIEEEFKTARKWIGEAQKVCFLGFGYDETNIERLDIPSVFHNSSRESLLGSAYRVEIDVRQRATKKLTYAWGESSPYGVSSQGTQKIDMGGPNTDAVEYLKQKLVLG